MRAAKHTLLDHVSLTVGQGEHGAILGANGAGKTTLLDVVRGVVAPSSGDLAVLEERHGAHGSADPRLRIGVVASSPPVFAARLTAGEAVVLRSAGPPALRGSRVDPDEVRRARATLSMVGCGDLVDRRYAACSHGERQRITLARALFRAPAIVLLDEPAAGLDLPGRAGAACRIGGPCGGSPIAGDDHCYAPTGGVARNDDSRCAAARRRDRGGWSRRGRDHGSGALGMLRRAGGRQRRRAGLEGARDPPELGLSVMLPWTRARIARTRGCGRA